MSKNSLLTDAQNQLYSELDERLIDEHPVSQEYVIDLIHRVIDVLEQCKDKG